jgi:hypothetical protein
MPYQLEGQGQSLFTLQDFFGVWRMSWEKNPFKQVLGFKCGDRTTSIDFRLPFLKECQHLGLFGEFQTPLISGLNLAKSRIHSHTGPTRVPCY